jgi:uncharacterized damage-inducible protein DinB
MINRPLIAELKQEAASTRKMLERVPYDKWEWKPHEKSMSIGRLPEHIADLLNWPSFAMTTTSLDFKSGDYKFFQAKNKEDLIEALDRHTAASLAALEAATDEDFKVKWSLIYGGRLINTLPRSVVLRSMVLNHVIHHRGQLSVYLRLLDIPVPGMYGPTADETF